MFLDAIFSAFDSRATWQETGHPKNAGVIQVLGHPGSGIIGWMGGQQTSSGKPVDIHNATSYAPVLAATRLLATSIASLRVDLLEDGSRSNPSRNHPVSRMINRTPNPEINAFNFRASRVAQQVNMGNAYAEIERNGAGSPIALHPIHAERVTPDRDDQGRVIYKVSQNDGKAVMIPQADMFHVASDVNDGLVGRGMVDILLETIGFGLATEEHGASFFGSGAVPEGILRHPGNMNREARQNLRKEWKEMHSGKREVGVLWEGLDYIQTSISPEQAQFLQTRRYNAEVIAQAYRVPQHMIGILDKSTYDNIEHQSKEFVRFTLLPWLKSWCHEISNKLLTPAEADRLEVRFAVEEFELIELESRTNAINDLWMNGGITLDERRAMEGLDSYNMPGISDIPWVPLNLAPAPAVVANAETLDEPNNNNDMRSELALRCFIESYERIAKNEVNAAKRLVNHPQEYIQRLDALCEKTTAQLREATSTSFAAYLATCDAESFDYIKSHIEESRQILLDAADGEPADLKERVYTALDAWPKRIKQLKEQLEAKGSDND